jgi:hypothetical protein
MFKKCFQVFRRNKLPSSINSRPKFSRRNTNKNSHGVIRSTKTINPGPSRVKRRLHGEVLTTSQNTEKNKQKSKSTKNHFKKTVQIPNESSSHQDDNDFSKECKEYYHLTKEDSE